MSEQSYDRTDGDPGVTDEDVAPVVGSSDAEADAEQAGAAPRNATFDYTDEAADLDHAARAKRDDDGVPVGHADAIADARAAGSDVDGV